MTIIDGLEIVRTSPPFLQCVEREFGGLNPETGCPIENFRRDRQIEMNFPFFYEIVNRSL